MEDQKNRMIRTTLCILAFSLAASASTISFSTTAGAKNGNNEAVSASGSITTNANGTITVTLADTLANPTDAGQLLSDLLFNIGTTPTIALNTTVTPTGGSLISIDGNGVATSSAAAIASWGLSSSGNTIHLDSLVGGPSQTLIGPGGNGGVYTNANGSIAGNGPHNPFMTGTATFNFAVGGVTDSTTISSPIFSFGTAAGDNVTGCIAGGPSCTSTVVPEPMTSGLVGLGVISVFFLRRRGRA